MGLCLHGALRLSPSHLLCLTAQVDAHRAAPELGELVPKFCVQRLLQPPAPGCKEKQEADNVWVFSVKMR